MEKCVNGWGCLGRVERSLEVEGLVLIGIDDFFGLRGLWSDLTR
jgi:hypothetical protein